MPDDAPLPPGRFALAYDALMFDPRSRAIYGDSDFFNVGYWRSGTSDQATACAQLVARLLAPVPDAVGPVLDAGCGCGGSTSEIKRLRPAAEVLGVNLSERQLRHGRAAAPDCRFALMDAAALACPDEAFDCVVSVEAAFHFSTRAAFLREAFRVLRPGGILTLSDLLFADVGGIGDWMVPPENRQQTATGYAALLHRIGYREVVLRDATASCWTAFCRARLAALEAEREGGLIDETGFAAARAYLANLLEGTVDRYLLVCAVKPGRSA